MQNLRWQKKLVAAQSKSQLDGICFSNDKAKGYAQIISGESGSGKSWYAKYALPAKFPNASFIYHEVSDEEARELMPKVANCRPDEVLSDAYGEALSILSSQGLFGHKAYNVISELARENNRTRNGIATEFLKDAITKVLATKHHANAWWTNPPSETIDELVIILDEIGKIPYVARGLVDEVRQIYCGIVGDRAEKVLLVLVGAGIDRFIEEDSPSFATREYNSVDAASAAKQKVDEKELLGSLVKFGTDPTKSQVAVLKGPTLEQPKIGGVDTAHILGGTYAKVLATNTRMLMRGVIPVLTAEMNISHIPEERLMERRIALGSTNIIMDYCARTYIALNGLQRLRDDKEDKLALDRVLLKQFAFILRHGLQRIRPALNPASCAVMDMVQTRDPRSDFEDLLQRGLISSNVASTSSALRYLACNGETAPLDAQDGVAFESVLQHHLLRLYRAKHYLSLECSDDTTKKPSAKEKFVCAVHSFAQAWPPSSTKHADLSTSEGTQTEVDLRYSNRGQALSERDTQEIKQKLKGANEYALVMRQSVSNAQGADVMVLSRSKTSDTAFLDLFQGKHLTKVPGPTTQKMIHAFASLGVAYDPQNARFLTEPTTGSAGYSYLGTKKLVEKLGSVLNAKVEIRKRVVAFSACWEDCKGYDAFAFEEAKRANVWIWTKEMIEPTISALPQGQLSSDDD